MRASHSTRLMTALFLKGSLVISIALTALLIVHGIVSENLLPVRILCGFVIITYLTIGELLIRKHRYVLAGWVLMILYTILGVSILVLWGVNTPAGILAIGLVVFLSGIILRPKHIIWVAAGIITLLCIVQYVHSAGYVKPELQILARPSDTFDILAYITILSVFALLSWLSSKQTEHSLNRAKNAEEKLRAEKDNLVIKLEEQSQRLRRAQLQEMLSLHKFAAIGQSTTATIHELSNLLSVLTLDIDDIGQQHQHSTAITNAKDGIEHINHLVRQTRRRLSDNQTNEVFNVIPIIEQSINELQSKFESRSVTLARQLPRRKSLKTLGDTANLSHVITILLKNALDACASGDDSKVSITISQQQDTLIIKISDNGSGIPKDKRPRLFSPHQSTKPNGLGIGLYITKHIIESQFNGKIFTTPRKTGASFTVELPRFTD